MIRVIDLLTGQETVRDYTAEELQAIAAAQSNAVVASVTMRQARLALLNANMLDQVEAAINAIPDQTQRKAAKIEWEYAATVNRQHQWVQNLSASLGLSDAQLDALFEAAASYN